MSDEQFSYDPRTFADESFAAEYSDLFDEFIALSIQGMPRELAIIDAFDMIAVGARLDNVKQLALAAQSNPYYKRNFAIRLKATPAEELWNEKKALNHLVRLVENEGVRESVRLAAIEVLNVLSGITEVDAAGKTKRVPTLGDLYGSMQASADMPYSDVRDDIERVRAAGLRQAEAEAKAKKGRTLQ